MYSYKIQTSSLTLRSVILSGAKNLCHHRRDPSLTLTVRAESTPVRDGRAEKKGESNCPLCAVGHDANKSKIWKLNEMDADHVTAWSKGGATDIKNCQMLCKTHNRAKGNR